MIQTKLKSCAGCKQLKHIWKSHGKEKYCRDCWYQLEKPKQISPVSKKMRETLDEYGKRRAAYLIVHPICQARLVGCTKDATDVHHKAGRGENHLKISTWLAVCRNCHTWITENSKEAIELGLSDSRLKTTE
jgi:RNA polymerase subunit RPABC4/transcription elongation factor Spt4